MNITNCTKDISSIDPDIPWDDKLTFTYSYCCRSIENKSNFLVFVNRELLL